ncbi:MAG TPA: response regulator transcription factor [Bryobacteraceae bacterium]|nr:response regulator transcription factor [Bryobacteraceae bacterium]
MPRTKVLLADDHTMFVEAMGALLERKFELLGTVHDGRALIEAVQELKPEVVVADVSMPVLNGVDAVRQIRKARPETKVVMLTMHADIELAVEAFRAGAVAYVLKSSPGEELIAAIEEAVKGNAYLTPLIAKDVISVLIEAKSGDASKAGERRLTARQREVLQLIAEGKTMKEIATLLNVSPRTAESHKYEMMEALGVKTTAELIQHAIRLKLVSIDES